MVLKSRVGGGVLKVLYDIFHEILSSYSPSSSLSVRSAVNCSTLTNDIVYIAFSRKCNQFFCYFYAFHSLNFHEKWIF